jgi:hypothetical protein
VFLSILSNFLQGANGLFLVMNLSVAYRSPRVPALVRTEEKPIYRLGVLFLVGLWALFSALTALVAVAAFVPGDLWLSNWLRLLGNSPMFTN